MTTWNIGVRVMTYVLQPFPVIEINEFSKGRGGIAGGIGGMGVFEECLIAEEMAFGCTGICTALDSSHLGVSTTAELSRNLLQRLLRKKCSIFTFKRPFRITEEAIAEP